MAPETSALKDSSIYNKTFTLHRVSPLSTPALNNDNLQQLARRFRDVLAGDVLRGVRVGLGPEDDALARVGTLKTVTWNLLSEDGWIYEDDTIIENDDSTIDMTTSRGMKITVTYERISYMAILFRASSAPVLVSSMQYYPLLFSKMPNSLRETFTSFLSATFDVRISLFHLSSRYIISTFESYICDISSAEYNEAPDVLESSRTLRNTVKDVVLYLSFDMPGGSSALRTVEISIAREDLPRMISRGKKIARRDSGEQEDQRRADETPFFNAIASYIKVHLALNLRDERVKISRIACGAFMMGAEGKIKLFQSGTGSEVTDRASQNLLDSLVKASDSGSL